LADPQLSACSPDHLKLLLDEQATLFNIKHAISGWLFQNATPDSTVLIYFAGHGGLENDKLGAEKDGVSKYLLPWDADLDNLFASALSSVEFHALLNTIRSQRLVIFMDACYAGGVSKGARDIGMLESPYARLGEGQGRLVIASAQPNQRSWEDQTIGHGIFTHHLLEAMQGKADSDDDGCVSVMDVFRYLQQTVPVSARRMAQNVQDPLLCGDISKDIVLTVNSARIMEIARQRSEAERRRREEIQRKRRRLVEMRDSDEIPAEMFYRVLPLLEKSPSELTAEESRVAGFLDAMLADKITVKLFLDSVQPLQEKPIEKPADKPPAAAAAATTGRTTITPPQPLKAAAIRFCIHCGTKVVQGNTFCIGCGRKYAVPS
jgi:hypothetical protein